MAVWSTRPSVYKMGVVVLFLGSVVYLIGYASPFWSDIKNEDDTHVYSGLWTICVDSEKLKTCGSTINEPGWLKAVQTIETLGLLSAVGACVYAIVANARQTPLPYNGRVVAVLSAFSGVSGFIGCIVFVTGDEGTAEKYLGWSAGFSIAGSIMFLLIAAPLIYIGSRDDMPSPATPGTVVLSRPRAAPVAVTLRQGEVYPPPGQGYPPQPGHVAQPVYGYDQGDSASAPGGYAPAADPPQAGYTTSECKANEVLEPSGEMQQ